MIAHELGHLRGLKHCYEPQCLMRPAQAAAEIDQRKIEPCGKCPRTGHRAKLAAIVAIAAGVLIFTGLDQAGRLLAPRSVPPISSGSITPHGSRSGGGSEATYLFFNGQPIMVERLNGSSQKIPCRVPSTIEFLTAFSRI